MFFFVVCFNDFLAICPVFSVLYFMYMYMSVLPAFVQNKLYRVVQYKYTADTFINNSDNSGRINNFWYETQHIISLVSNGRMRNFQNQLIFLSAEAEVTALSALGYGPLSLKKTPTNHHQYQRELGYRIVFRPNIFFNSLHLLFSTI